MSRQAEAKVVISATDRLTAPVKRMEERLGRMMGPVKRLQVRFKALSKAAGLDRLGKAIGNLGGKLRDAAGQAAGLGLKLGGAAVGAAAGLFALTKSVADQGDALGKQSRRLGLSVEALQEFRYAAERSGVEVGTMEEALKKLGEGATKAAGGSKEMQDAFFALGIPLTDAQGKMRSTEELFEAAVKVMGGMEDPVRRNALALKIFGESGLSLVTMAEGGIDAFRKMRGEARNGWLMSQDDTANAETFNDRLLDLTRHLTGLKDFIGSRLMPMFTPIIERLTAWAAANQDLIKSKVVAWVDRLRQVLADLQDPASTLRQRLDELWGNIQSGWALFQRLADMVGGPVVVAVGALSAVILGPLLMALAAVVPAIVAVGTALLTTPVGWVIGAVAAIAGAAYLIYRNWGAISEWLGGLWEGIKAAFSGGIGSIIATLVAFSPVGLVAQGVNALVKYLFGIDLAAAGGRIVDSLLDGLQARWQGLVAWMSNALKGLTGWMPDWAKEQLGFSADAAGPEAPSGRAGAGGAVKSETPSDRGDTGGQPPARRRGRGRLAGPLVAGLAIAAPAAAAAPGAGDPATGVPSPAERPAGESGGGSDARAPASPLVPNAPGAASGPTTINKRIEVAISVAVPPGADAAALGEVVRREVERVLAEERAAERASLTD